MAGDLANHDVAELVDRRDAAARPQRHRLRTLIDAAAGHFDVLRLQRAGDVVDGQVLRPQQLGVEPQVDLAVAAADDEHLADAVGAFQLPAQHLVGVLGDLAQRLLRRHGNGQHRRRRRIELLDRRLDHRARQQRNDPVDLVAHFLRRDVRILLEHERDDDLRDAFGRVRGQRCRCR